MIIFTFMHISFTLLSLLLLTHPSLSQKKRGKKEGPSDKKDVFKLGFQTPVFSSSMMPVETDKAKSKEAFRQSPTDVNNMHVSYILEGQTFKLASLKDEDQLVYERALKGEDYQGFRDMAITKNDYTMLVL